MHQTTNIKPVFSIVMPLYNKENEVKRSIDSVLTQTITSFELIIINDGSTDQGPNIVRTIQDNRITIIDQENAGVSAARNRGIKESKSDLIAFLDADDEWKATFLETILKLRRKFSNCSVFATGFLYLEQDGTLRHPIINGIPSFPWCGILENYFHIASISDPPLWTSAIVVTKNAITAANGFPVGTTSGEDLLTWARLAVKFKIAYDTETLALFRQRALTHTKLTRNPDSHDYVGISLKRLLKNIPPSKQNDLKHYIAFWHKIRASMYLQLNQRFKAAKEILKMGRFHLNIKFFIYCICLLLPVSFTNRLIRIYKKITPNKSVTS